MTFFTFDPLHEKKGLSAKSVNSQQGTILLLGDREAVIKSPVELINDSFIKGSFVIHETEIELTGLVLDLNSEKNIYNIIFSGMEKQKEKILYYIYQFYRE